MSLPTGWPDATFHPWTQTVSLPPVSYKCGYCSELVGSSSGFQTRALHNGQLGIFKAYVCGNCDGITLFDNQERHWPEATWGQPVSSLPPTVGELYAEARACMSVRAYTTSALACRKLLMNTAVSKGAKSDENFATYVAYLFDHGYIPPDARPWVDHIRSKGNEATHEISQTTEADAKKLITMTEVLLRHVYELPTLVNDAL